MLPLACVFDIGQRLSWLDLLLKDADRRAESQDIPISYSYAAVIDSPGLQAADVIATEHYWYSLEALEKSPPQMTPHFKSFVGMVNPTGYWLLEPEIEKIRDEYLAAFPIKAWFHSLRARRTLPRPNDL